MSFGKKYLRVFFKVTLTFSPLLLTDICHICEVAQYDWTLDIMPHEIEMLKSMIQNIYRKEH